MKQRVTPTLTQLVGIFIRTGSMAFGGGAATLAMLHDEFCVRQPFLSEQEFQLLWGLTRLLPGMNLLSLTVLLGYRSHGLTGAVLALVGLTVPSFAIIIAGCYLLRHGSPSPYLAGAIRGLGIAAAALLIHTGWQTCRGSLFGMGARARAVWLCLAIAGTILALIQVVSPAWIVLGGGAVGVLVSHWEEGSSR